MIYRKNINEIIEDLNNYGISKSNVNFLLDEKEYINFERTIDFYNSYKTDPHIIKRIKKIQNGIPEKQYLKW